MASSILQICVFAAVMFFVGRLRFTKKSMGERTFWCAAFLLFAAAFGLRIWLGLTSEGFSTDMDTFKAWARITNEVGFHRIYREDIFLDYPPGYLYVLTLLEKWRLFLGLDAADPVFTLLMKLPSILADLFCGGVLLHFGKKRLGQVSALFLSAAYLFCPAVYLNSAQWGQADSFCTAILLCSLLLLYREKYLPSAAVYGIAIACKPQMLIFAPVYIFFAIRQKRFWHLLGGIACSVVVLLIIATPFTRNFQYFWLVEKYQATMDYYNYYSVNAYNFWCLLSMNWVTLPEGFAGTVLNLLGPAIATLLCGVLFLFSKKKETIFIAPAVLMSAMYFFSVKMHERYLFPALLFLLLAYVFEKDRRLLWVFAANSLSHYLNVSFVLWQFHNSANGYDPNTGLTIFFASLQTLAFLYLLWVVCLVYCKGEHQHGVVYHPVPFPEKPFPATRFGRRDWVCMAVVTLLYGVVAFWNLGSHTTALTAWTPQAGDSVVLQTEKSSNLLCYLPGLTPDQNHYAARVGSSIRVETSTDGEHWVTCGETENTGIFAWEMYSLSTPGNYVRLTALDDSVTINEVGLRAVPEESYQAITLLSGEGENLLDEQETVPLYVTYENSSYFDEIYHARTAYEHILGLEPYECTHPTLGKLIISLGIRLFGMNPFGWRFMGTLFGVLMLPVFYHLLFVLFGKTSLSLAGTLLFAFDFMHFTQTRIATIDTYAVFFLLLMYDFMVLFIRQDPLRKPLRKLLLPLLACGVFTGIGIASKWTAAYGALGLAVLYFGKMAVSLRQNRRAENKSKLWKRWGVLCLWCCLFFLLIPFAIYFAAFLPITTLPHNIDHVFGAFVNYQVTMFRYHSQLVAEHFFASPWYEWPLDIRPIWYFMEENSNSLGQYSTISAMGNPLLWWSCLIAFFASLVLWFKKKTGPITLGLVAFLSVYLPWVLVPRLTFIYHYFTSVPFLIVLLLAVGGYLLQKPFCRRQIMFGETAGFTVGSVILWCFVGLEILLFLVFFPVISGFPVDKSYAEGLRLLPTWYF